MDTPPLGTNVTVHLVPRAGVSGMKRVNFAVPLAPGQLSDPASVRVLVGGAETPAARRALARHPDGSVRSVQIQIDVAIAGESDATVEIGRRARRRPPDGAGRGHAESRRRHRGPARVGAAAGALAVGSGVAGPQVPRPTSRARRSTRGARSATTPNTT